MSGRRELSGGTHGTKRKNPHLGRSQSERHATPHRRPAGIEKRSKSLGGLECLLSKISIEFEDVQKRDKEAAKKVTMEQVAVQHKERWKRTRENLFETARSVLYSSLPIGRDTLEVGATALGYSPVAVLAPPLRVLLYIWDALLLVQQNASWCLALTERCVDILIIIENEILEAGADVALDLKVPLAALTQAFESVRDTLLKETKRSFIKRYLRRKETKDELAGCEGTLTYALNLFGLKIQIRSLRQLEETEKLMNEAEENRTKKEVADKNTASAVNNRMEIVLKRLNANSDNPDDMTMSSTSHSGDTSSKSNFLSRESFMRDESSPDIASRYGESRVTLVGAESTMDTMHASTQSTYSNDPSESSSSGATYTTAPSEDITESYFDAVAPTEAMRIINERMANVIRRRSARNLMIDSENDQRYYTRMREVLRRAADSETTDDQLADILSKLQVDPQELPTVLEELSDVIEDQETEIEEPEGFEWAQGEIKEPEGFDWTGRVTQGEIEQEEEDTIEEDFESASGSTPSLKSCHITPESPGSADVYFDAPDSPGSCRSYHSVADSSCDSESYESAPESAGSIESFQSLPESAGSIESFQSAVDQPEQTSAGPNTASEDVFYDAEPIPDQDELPAFGWFIETSIHFRLIDLEALPEIPPESPEVLRRTFSAF